MPAIILQAGKLRQRIKIVNPTLAQDTFGGTRIDVAAPFAIVWASVEALSGRELYAAQQKVSEVTHRVRIRWMRGVKPQMNIWLGDPDGDREFQIQSVENPDETRHYLDLLCVERDLSAREEGGGGD
jgi:SPP1 family predicted phage head-tail adaptor